MKSVEIFSGAGGLALGTAMAGFRHHAIVERDKRSCTTIRANQQQGFSLIQDWQIHQMDVANFDYSTMPRDIDLLAGGPPCQPFSIGGKHAAYLDKRDLFPEFFRAVRKLQPKAFVIENVRGLLRKSFADYFQYIILQLTYPELVFSEDESIIDRIAKLQQFDRHNSSVGLQYQITYQLINAADYGIPQKRERVFIIGFRSDLNSSWSFPDPTHSEIALMRSKWITEDYWERHQIPTHQRSIIPDKLRQRLERQSPDLFLKTIQPWRTLRDSISDLPPPESSPIKTSIFNHTYIPGAKSYPGHTGSPLDLPAKTVKAGVHGVPGGENTIAFADGTVRYLTVREAARLQTFPDTYYFPTGWGESMRQIGNAVPVELAQIIGMSIYKKII